MRILRALGLASETDLRRLAEEKRDLQVQAHEMRSELERLREDAREARSGERAAYQLMVNVSFQQKFGGYVPFPAAPHLPDYKPPPSAGSALDDGQARIDDIYREAMAASRQEFGSIFDM